MLHNKLINFFHPEKRKLIHSIYFKSRYLIVYIFIGFIAILLELQIRSLLINFSLNEFSSSIISLPISVIIAFFLNIKFNFKIQKKKIFESFVYFFLISSFSLILQYFLREKFKLLGSYDQDRMVISGSCFLIFYFLHIKFSFKDYIKVGVAIYANGFEDIRSIYDKIGPYPDFIHVDIVDKTYLENADETKSYKLEIIKALWPSKKIHVHIMSKYPSMWIEKVKDYADNIFFHYEINEKIEEIIEQNKKYRNKLGLAVSVNTRFEDYKNSIKLFDKMLFLTIKKPGFSGQQLVDKSYEYIDKINLHTKNKNFTLCVDGGVNIHNIKNIKADEIVSGSYILKNQDPTTALLSIKFSV